MFENIKFKKGFQRITLSFCVLSLFIGIFCAFTEMSFIPFIVGLIVAIFIYLGFIFLCWIISGFKGKDEAKEPEKINFKLPFIYSTVIIVFLMTFCGFQAYWLNQEKNNYEMLKINNENLLKDKEELQQQVDYDNSIFEKIIEKDNKRKQVAEYFTIGSSMEEVRKIQGTPTRISNFEYTATAYWYYDNCSITFKNSLVESYDNDCGILKVK